MGWDGMANTARHAAAILCWTPMRLQPQTVISARPQYWRRVSGARSWQGLAVSRVGPLRSQGLAALMIGTGGQMTSKPATRRWGDGGCGRGRQGKATITITMNGDGRRVWSSDVGGEDDRLERQPDWLPLVVEGRPTAHLMHGMPTLLEALQPAAPLSDTAHPPP